ncbi:MAG: long-chain fatty acid--CoA ligase [Myxococcales bacterium]|nr:long-chain fatty acid--CoA ligase [Myxococcales bacterium]
MDVTPYLQKIEPAPVAVFNRLETHRDKPRFLLPRADGQWTPVTWGQFATEIEELGAYLIGRGIVHRDRGAVFAPNRVEWMSAALAIEAAGGVMVPVYPASTAEQAAYVIEHSDARVVFVDTAPLLAKLYAAAASMAAVEAVVLLDDAVDAAAVAEQSSAKHPALASAISALRERVVRFSDARSKGRALLEKDPEMVRRSMAAIDLDAPAVMLYTSGTTGNPKGVPLTHNNVGFNGRDWLVCNGPVIDEGGVDVLWLPFSHIFGFGEACLGNTLGFTTYMSDPATVLSRLPEVKPTIFMSVPAYWEKIAMAVMNEPDADAKRAKLAAVTGGRLQFCLSGGAGLKREVKELFHACGVLIIEGYGLTECSPTLTLNRPDRFRFDSVGVALPSVELKLAEDGEILAKGANVFAGYHKDPEATRGAFTDDGWFKTGDVGRWTEDGFLQIIDRKKDILVTAGGKNVPPVNIEIRFADEPLFTHVVVYGDGKRFLTAGVWINEAIARSLVGDGAWSDPSARESALRTLVQERVDRVNAQLANYESIKKFVIMPTALTVEGGMLTASLKVRRKKVYEAFRGQFEALYEQG